MDKNDDCIYNEREDHTLVHVIKYIRDEKRVNFIAIGQYNVPKMEVQKRSTLNVPRERETVAKVEVVSHGLNIRMARCRPKLSFIMNTRDPPTMMMTFD